MILLNIFKRKKEQEQVPELRSKAPKFLGRTHYIYKAQCVLTYNGGKAIRTFESTIKGYSRKHAVKQINDGYKVEVTKIHRLKQ